MYVATIETKAWKGKFPYIYFEFKKTGIGWRWLGVYECAGRSNDFRYEQGVDQSEKDSSGHRSENEVNQDQKKRLKPIVDSLKRIITTKNFKSLSAYVTNNKVYSWGPCGPGDSGCDELSFREITEMLLRNSNGVTIYFNPKPNVDEEKASIETEGWIGETPFLTFYFDFLRAKNKWVWNGTCYSNTPAYETKMEGRYIATYFREPQLPRPGPRIFKHYSPLHARIEEIVRFKAFDALKPYAIRKALTFGPCNLEMMQKDSVMGKESSVQDVVSFLTKNVPSGEIKSLGMEHKTYYETTGWNGEYPFVAFWFAEGKKGWELSGVSYCKTRHFDLFAPLSPLK